MCRLAIGDGTPGSFLLLYLLSSNNHSSDFTSHEHSVIPEQKPAQVFWHVITPEYPPMFGGVSDYTQSIAKGLAAQGDEVHVWCPAGGAPEPDSARVVVHPELGKIRDRDLRGVEPQLDRFPAPRRILIQWVPHAYGPHAINIGFCWF